jgi:hypothetical protein
VKPEGSWRWCLTESWLEPSRTVPSPGLPIAIPDDMSAAVESTLAAFKQTIVQLDILIDAHETTPDGSRY